MSRKIFINLPVKDLNKSVGFFTQLGFEFNPDFTDENATCMIISEDIFAMLLTHEYFKTFIQKDISDAFKSTEAIIALSFDSKEEVDKMVDAAKVAGATEYKEIDDKGWMYTRAFEDLDGHLWEIFYMDANATPQE